MAFVEGQSQKSNFDNGTKAIIKIDNPQKWNFDVSATELPRRMSDVESRTGNRIRRNKPKRPALPIATATVTTVDNPLRRD
jgi:hypothetical protein